MDSASSLIHVQSFVAFLWTLDTCFIDIELFCKKSIRRSAIRGSYYQLYLFFKQYGSVKSENATALLAANID